MERMFKKFFTIATLLSVVAINAAPVVSYYKARPQSFNGARKVSGEVGHVHLYDMDEWYGSFWITPSYTRTFRSSRIACCLFGEGFSGDGDCRSIKVQGSSVANRDSQAWLADNFYLSDTFNGTLSFEPRISNFILDFNLYLGLDEWVNGLYVRLYGPFVHTRWDLNSKESISSAGATMAAGKFASPVAAIPAANLLQSAEAFFHGDAPTDALDGEGPGLEITRKALCCSKFSSTKCSSDCKGRRTENGFGEIRGELGWNFWQDEDYHFGLNVQFAAPTGNRPDGQFLFDAIVGNGKHWELGGGATGHYVFWRSEDEEKHFGVYGDLNVTHLFNAKQRRCFDLCQPLSRYMLAARHRNDNITHNLSGNTTNNAANTTRAQFQFDGVYEPIGNLTSQEVKVSVGAQVDLSAWFNYTSGGFSFDAGYNFWYSSCERFKCEDKCPPRLANEAMWAIKGDARTFGFFPADTVRNEDRNDPIALAVSQKDATIFQGTNEPKGDDGKLRNFGVDSAQFAAGQDGVGTNGAIQYQPNQNQAGAQQIKLSIQPNFIKEDDINLQRSRGMSHKVFGHFAYTWDREGWVPYLGIGGEAEFGRNDCKSSSCGSCGTSPCTCTTSCSSSCSDCVDCSLSQWGVWLKAGISFD